MGKKRIITNAGASPEGDSKSAVVSAPKKSAKLQVFKGTVYVFSSYNNTIVSVADPNGNVFAFSSAGTLGFKGARKSTPYAATLVGKDAVEKAKKLGFQEAKITIKGIGPGREAAIRGIASTGVNITSIIDATPAAHNGVRAAKPRRV
jgi:small subunit ribosomal protein S11